MYIGVKELISNYKKPFDRVTKATKKAKANLKERGEKASGEILQEEVELVLAEWDEKTLNGQKAHDVINKKQLTKDPSIIVSQYEKHDADSNIEIDAGINILERNKRYIEKQIVSNHHYIIGYADLVEVTRDGYINIEDYKTWDKIYRTSAFLIDNGFKVPATYFFPPISHIQDTNYWAACLQLSIYMYILWTYNKKLKPGKLYIRHIPLNDKGMIIDETLIEVPYLREEVKNILKNMKLNG